ncbi:MAG: pyridoxine 5'-phosphate synthase [Deltaproteobacteria bacterium]|nr:pyridoxine 5'-phosphate synthase [Deltaproteobacteria bacterium]
MARLGVNIDHVATVRQARGVSYPDPVEAAVLVELAGAHGIVTHLREDRRHIQDRDLYILRKVVKSQLNMEMAATDEMIKIAIDTRPEIATIVPEKREELTTEGGLNVISQEKKIGNAIEILKKNGIHVSLFVDPDPETIKMSAKLNADSIEIHTGHYCEAKSEAEKDKELNLIKEAVAIGKDLGLRIAAGHGLNYFNVAPVAVIKDIEEFNIGHSIIARAIFVGLERAVKDMLALIQ